MVKTAGWLLILLPFMGAAAFAYWLEGIFGVLILFGITAAICGAVAAGIYLVNRDT